MNTRLEREVIGYFDQHFERNGVYKGFFDRVLQIFPGVKKPLASWKATGEVSDIVVYRQKESVIVGFEPDRDSVGPISTDRLFYDVGESRVEMESSLLPGGNDTRSGRYIRQTVTYMAGVKKHVLRRS